MLAPPREEGVTSARKAARSVAAAAGVVLLAPVVLTLLIDRDRGATPAVVEPVELASPPSLPEMPEEPDTPAAPETPASTALAAGALTAEDRASGLLSSSVPDRGSG